MAPRVCIGMPVYDSNPEYFDAAIDGVLSQTFEDFEVILADNASTNEASRDRYAAAAQRDKRIRYVRHETNRGAIANFKYVITEARGEFFSLVADDDLHASTFLEKGVELLSNKPRLVGTSYASAIIELNGDRVGTARMDPQSAGASSPIQRIKALRAPNFNFPIYGLHRTAVLQKLDLTQPTIFTDLLMMTDLLLHGPLGHIDEELFSYRIDLRKESDSYRIAQHMGNQQGASATQKYSQAAFLALATVLASKAPLGTSERALCVARLAAFLFEGGWFTRDEFYRALSDLKTAVGDRRIGRAIALAAKVVLCSPSYPYRRWRGRRALPSSS